MMRIHRGSSRTGAVGFPALGGARAAKGAAQGGIGGTVSVTC